MGFIIRFAFKNIWRYKKRTIITFSAIAIGILTFVFLDCMLKGFYYESVRNFIHYESGHIKIYNREFYKEMSDEGFLLLDEGIDKPDEIENMIKAENVDTAPRTTFSASLVNRRIGGERPFTVIGIDPEKDRDVYKLPEALVDGRFLKSDENGIMMGSLGAKKMEVELGDRLTILTRTKNETYQAISVNLVGILHTPNPNINKRMAYIPLSLADADLEMEGSVTEIGIRYKSDDVDDLLEQVSSKLATANLTHLQAISWKELGKDWLTFAQTKQAGSYAIIIVVFIIAAVGIANTMLMSVFERIREIGMMRALGMTDGEVFWEFIFEGCAIGFLGSCLGVFLGLIVNAYVVYHGLDWGFLGNLEDIDIGYRVLWGVIKGVWNPKEFIFAFVFSTIIPALITIFPSRRAIKMEITQALRD